MWPRVASTCFARSGWQKSCVTFLASSDYESLKLGGPDPTLKLSDCNSGRIDASSWLQSGPVLQYAWTALSLTFSGYLRNL